ncbi:MAG: hypothetical protein MK085_07890, partial [Phycisphaerales bacterium]|nr:hypothetical protein [Phycisphaerales bacterium]
MRSEYSGGGSRVRVLATGLVLGAIPCLAPIDRASAEITISFDGMHMHERVVRNYESTATWNAPKRLGGQVTPSGILSFNDGDYHTFCIELKQPATSNPISYELESFSDMPGPVYQRSLILSSLFEQYYDQLLAGESRALAAAFSMLTWEIMLEGFTFIPGSVFDQINIDTGAVQFSDVSEEAGSYYREMAEQLYIAESSENIMALTNPDFQDQVVWIPSPAAAALACLLGLVRRRRRTG